MLTALLPLCLLATQATAPDEGEPETFEASDVFELEYASDPQVSPDGKTVVYVRRSADRLKDRFVGDLWTVDIETGAHRPLVDGAGPVSAPRWSPSGDRLAYLGGEGDRPELRVLYLDTGRSFSLAQLQEAPGAPVWSPDGGSLAFAMLVPGEGPSLADGIGAPEGAEWPDPVRVFDDVTFRADGEGYLEPGKTHVFTVSAEGGTPRQVTRGETEFGGPAWLDEDTLLVVGNTAEDAALDPIESEVYAVELAGGEPRALTARDGPDASPVVSPDGSQIAYVGYDDEVLSHQQNELYVMPADGGEPRLLTGGYDRSVGQVSWMPDGSGLVGLVETDGDLSVVLFPLEGAPRVLTSDAGGTSLGRPYASGEMSVAMGEGGEPVIAYTQASPDRPAELAVIAGGQTRTLTALNEDVLPDLDLARIEEIKVPSSADGLEIEAWIAYPPGFEEDGDHPLLLEIHGGPFAQYGPFFAAEIQRYAAEGYVTVYANPRGSTGYGEEFALEIDLAYPGEDYDDLMSVVDAVIERGGIDEDRLFVTGGSGGGVLTAWIVGTTDRFAAAATVKPVINWTTMALSADIAPYVARHWLRAMPWEDRERYWSLSPISRVGNVTTPTLVMVGEEDFRTPAWEAEQFYTALQLRGVDTTLVRIPGASHSIASRPSRLIAKTDNIMGWFSRYDPAKAEAEEGAPTPAD